MENQIEGRIKNHIIQDDILDQLCWDYSRWFHDTFGAIMYRHLSEDRNSGGNRKFDLNFFFSNFAKIDYLTKQFAKDRMKYFAKLHYASITLINQNTDQNNWYFNDEIPSKIKLEGAAVFLGYIELVRLRFHNAVVESERNRVSPRNDTCGGAKFEGRPKG